MAKQRISYVDPATITDGNMLAEFDRCRREGTPRPESQAIKELCRVYVSHSVKCEYCGNQRSIQSANQGLVEDDYLDLLNFEKSDRYDPRQKAALAYTEAIVWDLEAGDDIWDRLNAHFSEAEIVELGYFVAITMGQQRWLRTLNIDHHQVLAGTDGSMAPGTETAEALAATKASDDYWAKRDAAPGRIRAAVAD